VDVPGARANAAEIQAVTAAGAFIMGRNMFGPGRDDWDLVEGTKPLPTGKVTVGFDFDYDGGGLHKRATGTLFVNGTKVGEGRIDKTMGAVYSLAGETADVGMDAYSPGDRRLRPLGQRPHRHHHQGRREAHRRRRPPHPKPNGTSSGTRARQDADSADEFASLQKTEGSNDFRLQITAVQGTRAYCVIPTRFAT
jgi:hypothetical protein